MQSIVELAQRATGKTQMKSETEYEVARSEDFLFDLNDELELLNSTNSLKCEYREVRRGEKRANRAKSSSYDRRTASQPTKNETNC